MTTTMSFSSLPPLLGLRVLRAGELVGDEDAVVALAVVAAGAVEVLAADALHRQRPDVAQDDRGGVELVAAEFGHEPAAGLARDPPADEFAHVLEAVLVRVAERQRLEHFWASASRRLPSEPSSTTNRRSSGMPYSIAYFSLSSAARACTATSCCGATGRGCA